MRRFPRLRDALINMGLVVASIFLFVLVCEFVVFRFILLASDSPGYAFANGVVRYAPNQSGVWRVRNEIAAPFRINAQGWNSPLPDYARERRPGVERIAFIGDSFVEGFQVPVDKNFAEIVGAARANPAEVYRFGISAAPLSQYLQMMEREVVAFRPDCIVILLIHNDFNEGIVFDPSLPRSYFRKLRIEDGKVIADEQPAPWRPRRIDLWRESATFRFFRHRWQVRTGRYIDSLLPAARADTRDRAVNIDVARVLGHKAEMEVAADYLIGKLAEQARAIGVPLLLVMDGDRHAIYEDIADPRPNIITRMAADAAARHGVPFLDLYPVFAADWAKNRRQFEFESDYHWNEHGHTVAGAAVAKVLWPDDSP